MILVGIIAVILIIYSLFYLINKTYVPLSEAKAELKKNRNKRFFTTEDFKVKKKINDGDKVELYSIPDSLKVNIYESNSFGGEGFLYKIYDRNVWKAVEENRIISAKIHRTEKNKAYTKIIFQ